MLHLGSGYIAPPGQVVLILDARGVEARAYLNNMLRGDRLRRMEGEAKSLIICQGRHSAEAYLSPIAPRTLARRFAMERASNARADIPRLTAPRGRLRRSLEASND